MPLCCYCYYIPCTKVDCKIPSEIDCLVNNQSSFVVSRQYVTENVNILLLICDLFAISTTTLNAITVSDKVQ